MNILLFTPIPSHPHYHGHRKRIYNLTRYLKEMGHDIHFVYFNEDPLKDCDLAAMSEEWKTFTLIPRGKQLNARHGNYDFDEWYQDDISLHVNKIIDLFHIDIIWMNYVWQSKLFELVPQNILKVIDTHDKFTDRYKVLGDNGNKGYSWFSCSKEDEGKYFDRANVVVSIQKEEESYFKEITNSKVYTIGHIEKKNFLNKKYVKLQKIGFLGAHNYINEKAINGFLDIFYSSSKYHDKIEIIIAGSICNIISHKHPNIKLMGIVENLDDFYKDLDLIINPLQFGTGLKIKTAEALSYGLPIVSSTIGFEGIESDSIYHQSTNLQQMVASVDAIYENPQELENLAMMSENIFIKYEKEIFLNINSILNLQKTREHKENIQLLKVYKELQSERIKSITSKGVEYINLMQKIESIAKTSSFKNPVLKFKAYKDLMRSYNFYRKQ